MGQVLYSPAKEYRIMEGHDREAEALQSGVKKRLFRTAVLKCKDCNPYIEGLESAY